MTAAPATPVFPPGSRGRLGLAALLALAAGCSSFGANLLSRDRAEAKGDRDAAAAAAPAPPGKYSFRLAPYVFVADFELRRDQPLFQDLANLRNQVSRELQLPVGAAAVQVYLFESKDRYDAFIKARYPTLPPRRAFFVAQPRPMGGAEDLLVYTYWGERIQQDLRHELTHALLHSVIRNVPLWLDEGLAEYFELPPEQKGVNAAHVAHLCNGPGGGPYRPDLDRLEKMTEVGQMNRPEYREAWAWVHLLLHSTPEARAVLTGYLQQLHENRTPGPLGPRLAAVFPAPEDSFTRHVGQLAASPLPPTPPPAANPRRAGGV
jgi:hypothetical protein